MREEGLEEGRGGGANTKKAFAEEIKIVHSIRKQRGIVQLVSTKRLVKICGQTIISHPPLPSKKKES